MPLYELILIGRNMAKNDLFSTLQRSAKTLLNHGGVITKMQSLGHRDLPYKHQAKQTKETIFAANYFLMDVYLSRTEKNEVSNILYKDLDLIRYRFTKIEHITPFKCTLNEELKPPVEREAVKKLREGQKMSHFTRMITYKKIEKNWRATPKSFPIPPHYE